MVEDTQDQQVPDPARRLQALMEETGVQYERSWGLRVCLEGEYTHAIPNHRAGGHLEWLLLDRTGIVSWASGRLTPEQAGDMPDLRAAHVDIRPLVRDDPAWLARPATAFMPGQEAITGLLGAAIAVHGPAQGARMAARHIKAVRARAWAAFADLLDRPAVQAAQGVQALKGYTGSLKDTCLADYNVFVGCPLVLGARRDVDQATRGIRRRAAVARYPACAHLLTGQPDIVAMVDAGGNPTDVLAAHYRVRPAVMAALDASQILAVNAPYNTSLVCHMVRAADLMPDSWTPRTAQAWNVLNNCITWSTSRGMHSIEPMLEGTRDAQHAMDRARASEAAGLRHGGERVQPDQHCAGGGERE